MFSRLDPLFRSILKEPEKIDSWLGIYYDEDREKWRGKKNDHSEGNENEDQDETVISIEGFAGFLKSLLSEEDTEKEDKSPSPDSYMDKNSPEARAAGAYQKTANNSSEYVPISHIDRTENTGEKIDISPKEKLMIEELVNDMEYLLKHGISYLPIENSEISLLDGLIEVVKNAKSGPKD